MSTNHCINYKQTGIPCECEYDTLPGAFTATTVATKVDDTFFFRGLAGINGTTVTQNGNIIEIDGGGGNTSLQTAYDNGNTIVTANTLPVDIIGNGQPLLNVHDSGDTGLFSIVATTTGDANIVFNNSSGILFNPPTNNTSVPTVADPYTRILSDAPPSVLTNTGLIPAAVSSGAATVTNSAFLFTAPVNTSVHTIDILVTGVNATPSSFSFHLLVKFAPSGVSPVLTSITSSSVDALLVGLTIVPVVSANDINFMLVGGPNPGTPQYLVRSHVTINSISF